MSSQADVIRLLAKSQAMLAAFLYAQCEDYELVEEAGQETSVYVCAHWQDFQAGSSFGAWVRAIAGLRLKELIRQQAKRRRVQALDSLAEEIPDAVWNAESVFDAQHKTALAACLGSLPAHLRQLVTLRFAEDRDGAAIAQQLNKSVESVYMALSRLRRLLKDCVEQRLAERAP